MSHLRSTSFYTNLREKIQLLGGLYNAHLHLDRAGTYDETVKLLNNVGDEGVSHLSLPQKHSLIPMIHASSCYDPDLLEQRVDGYVELMINAGTTRADTVVDVTDDCVGRQAFDRFLRVKDRRSEVLDLQVGAYSPLGFRDDEPRRWALLEEVAESADFIGALPERDDREPYPEHIGFEENCRRMLLLTARLGKPIHIHVDQQNHEMEAGTECVTRVVRDLGLGCNGSSEPQVWLVHVISPSTYDEARFKALVESLVDLNIGVICCPSAAISMLQVRPYMSPTYNSIARVLDMLAAGVQVRLGSDNICDITSPAGTTDLVDEIFILSNAMRYYDLDIMAKLGAGQALDAHDREKIRAHLRESAETVNGVVSRYGNLVRQ